LPFVDIPEHNKKYSFLFSFNFIKNPAFLPGNGKRIFIAFYQVVAAGAGALRIFNVGTPEMQTNVAR
jgi:hypothetical protein